MTKIRKSKFKISRRLYTKGGGSLWGNPKDSCVVRNYGPGQHGPESINKPASDYKKQLMAKQRLKGYYGRITEKQFKKIYKEAIRLKGDTSENLISLLESRLDAVIYRLNLVPTVFASRQLVSHKHVKVNGKTVNIPSYRLKDGDVVTVSDTAKNMPLVIEAVKKKDRSLPDYLEFDDSKFEGIFSRKPASINDVPYPVRMEPNLVIEYYSR